ncbi:MAG: metallophosphoesterase [Lachnospiraceae bacterium]|nr:metallophosphoesterase [Lachnospiraceae bacterium]
MYDYIYQESLKRAKHKVWILSDLQQRNPVYTRECLEISMEDYYLLGAPADMIWYLGDAVEGDDRNHLLEMCALQEKAFDGTGLPLCYTIGNHDFDYSASAAHRDEPVFIPFYEMVKAHPGWHAAADYTQPFFQVQLGDFSIYFFGDHIAPDKSWRTSHGQIHGDLARYPHGDIYDQIREEIAAKSSPVITASHYSYYGGNRAADLLSRLLPLPQNVKLHVYGHAHIGDFAWAKEHAWRRISWVDWHDIPQINVSSFEHIRGKCCRSVFLHLYEDHSMGVFFRNHDEHVFSECYFPAKGNYSASWNNQ